MKPKRLFQIATAALLLGSLTLQAEPDIVFTWQVPQNYVNGVPIVSDPLIYTLKCSDTQGGPYNVEIGVTDPNAPPTLEDMAPIVNDTPGTYYCVSTATSTLYGSESPESNEANFTVSPGDLGFVPEAPRDFRIQ